MRKTINVYLSDEDMKFVKWMAKRDNLTTSEELSVIFNTEFEHCKALYTGEMEQEENDD